MLGLSSRKIHLFQNNEGQQFRSGAKVQNTACRHNSRGCKTTTNLAAVTCNSCLRVMDKFSLRAHFVVVEFTDGQTKVVPSTAELGPSGRIAITLKEQDLAPFVNVDFISSLSNAASDLERSPQLALDENQALRRVLGTLWHAAEPHAHHLMLTPNLALSDVVIPYLKERA